MNKKQIKKIWNTKAGDPDPLKKLLSMNLSYYVILTVDLTKEQKKEINWDVMHGWNHKKQMRITENKPDYSGDYHRKLVGMLNQREFDLLVDDFWLGAQPVETMGSLTELGYLNAVWFTNCEFGTNAYVTPFFPWQMDPTEGDEQPNIFGEGMSEELKQNFIDHIWEEQRKVIIEVYGE